MRHARTTMTTMILTFALTLAASVGVVAQDLPPLPQAFLSAGGGQQTNNFVWGAYARQTGINAGTNFPIYTYYEVKTYDYRHTAKTFGQATDLTVGALAVFYDRKLAGLRVTLAVDGNVGPSLTADNVGYSVGAKVIARIARPTSRWGIILSADPSRSSVAGVHASQASFGLSYGFGGF